MWVDWPVVGREEELAAISAGLRHGVGCVVVGEPGVGKTIVLRELRRRLAAAGRDSQLMLATTAAQSATALTAGDARRLDSVSARFEDLGTLLLAAEASYAGAAAHQAAGDQRPAAVSLARAIALHARCEGAFIPWIAPQGGGVLTPREQQVAVLAAAGRTDARGGGT